MPSLEELLTERSYDELMEQDAYPVLGDGVGMPFVLRLHDGLVDALLAADDDQLHAVARTWSQAPEMAGADPAALFRFVSDLRTLAVAASRQGQHLYCWVA